MARRRSLRGDEEDCLVGLLNGDTKEDWQVVANGGGQGEEEEGDKSKLRSGAWEEGDKS